MYDVFLAAKKLVSLNISLSRFYFCLVDPISGFVFLEHVCTGKAVCYSIYFDVIYIS